MATYIGNPDPPVSRLSRPKGDPATNISMGQVDEDIYVGSLFFSKAISKIVPGTTSISLRNNADSADNLIITDAGNVTVRGTLTFGTGSTAALATANGASETWGVSSELITLSTSTTVTTSTTNLLPANSIIDSVTANCQVAILTATSYKVGDPTSDARFITFTTSIGLNQASVGFNQLDPALATTKALSAIQVSATTVKITTAAATPPTAGKIRVSVFYRTFAGPTS